MFKLLCGDDAVVELDASVARSRCKRADGERVQCSKQDPEEREKGEYREKSRIERKQSCLWEGAVLYEGIHRSTLAGCPSEGWERRRCLPGGTRGEERTPKPDGIKKEQMNKMNPMQMRPGGGGGA